MNRKNKEVFLLSPPDHRGIEIRVNRETDVGLKCDKHEGVEYRIFKHGPGWSFPNRDRFFAVMGNPLTSYVDEDENVHNVSVPEFLKFAWGSESIYDKLPDHLKSPLEGKWGATVTVKPVDLDPSYGLDRLKAQTILREHNIDMMEDFARAEPKPEKLKKLVEMALPILFGFFAGVVAQMKGWF